MKRVMGISTIILTILLCICVVHPEAVFSSGTTKPAISVESKNGNAGETVEVNVYLENNPGIAGATLQVEYDDGKMMLSSAESGEALGNLTFTKSAQFTTPARFLWDSESGVSKQNGVLLKLKFQILNKVVPGEQLPIHISYAEGDIYDENLEDMEIQLNDGVINIEKDIESEIETETETEKVTESDKETESEKESESETTVPTTEKIVILPEETLLKQGTIIRFTAKASGTNKSLQDIIWSVKGNVSKDTVLAEDGELTIAKDEKSETLTITAVSNEGYEKGVLELTVLENDTTPQKPEKAEAENITSTSVRLVQKVGCEYSMDAENWQNDPFFANLESDKEYTFFQRVKETAINYASESSEGLTVTTLPEKENNHEHTFGEPIFTWAEDGKSCTVTFVCEENEEHTEMYEAVVSSSVKVKATCLKMGITVYKAVYGEYSSLKEMQDIPVDIENHEGEKEIANVQQATCESDGYSGDTYCNDCGEKLESGIVIPATGHSFGEYEVVKEPTSTEEGLKSRTCGVCGKVESVTIPKKENTDQKETGTKDTDKDQKETETKDTDKNQQQTETPDTKPNQQPKPVKKTTKKIKLNRKKLTLKKGKTFKLKVTLTPKDSQDKITYKTSNKKIAAVSKTGKIKAKKKGKVKITVISGKKKAVCTVKVK